MGSVSQQQFPARQAATLASTAPDINARYADPDDPALDPGFWHLRGAVDKILAAGSQYAGGYDSRPFELLDTAWLPIAPAQRPNADASSSATLSAPNEPGSSLSGLAFGVLNAALGSGVALTVATAALGGASEAPAESSTRAWNQDEVLHRLGLIDEGNQSDSKPLLNFWRLYGSIAPAGWKRWLWFRPHQAPVVPILPENSNGNIDLGAIKPAWSSAPSIYAIQVPNDWDSEKVAAYIYGVITDSDHPSRWCRAFEEYLASPIDGVNTKEFEKLMKSVKTQILRKAGQNAELYLKLAVGVAPGGSGVLALNALSKGDYAEASLEVFFLIPWLRFAGGRLNHIKIVARNGDEVIVSRQAVEAWQQVVYNGGEAGLKRAEGLGQALKAGGRNADDIVDALKNAKVIQAANPRTFSRSANFTPSTGRTYKVFLRNDINWDHVRTAGPRDFIGKTNAEAARAGLRPQLADGSFATLHHSQQSALGPWFEASTRYHNIHNAQRAPLHPYGASQHPHHPLGRGPGSLREQFQRIESPEYWIWREANR